MSKCSVCGIETNKRDVCFDCTQKIFKKALEEGLLEYERVERTLLEKINRQNDGPGRYGMNIKTSMVFKSRKDPAGNWIAGSGGYVEMIISSEFSQEDDEYVKKLPELPGFSCSGMKTYLSDRQIVYLYEKKGKLYKGGNGCGESITSPLKSLGGF